MKFSDWLLGRAVRRIHRIKVEGKPVVLSGLEEGGGWWITHRTLEEIGGHPTVVLGKAPIPVMEWSERRLKRWLKDHPAPDQ